MTRAVCSFCLLVLVMVQILGARRKLHEMQQNFKGFTPFAPYFLAHDGRGWKILYYLFFTCSEDNSRILNS